MTITSMHTCLAIVSTNKPIHTRCEIKLKLWPSTNFPQTLHYFIKSLKSKSVTLPHLSFAGNVIYIEGFVDGSSEDRTHEFTNQFPYLDVLMLYDDIMKWRHLWSNQA